MESYIVCEVFMHNQPSQPAHQPSLLYILSELAAISGDHQREHLETANRDSVTKNFHISEWEDHEKRSTIVHRGVDICMRRCVGLESKPNMVARANGACFRELA